MKNPTQNGLYDVWSCCAKCGQALELVKHKQIEWDWNFYFKPCECKAARKTNKTKSVNWITEPPTETGWYWVKTPSGTEIVEVDRRSSGQLVVSENGYSPELKIDDPTYERWYPEPIKCPGKSECSITSW